MDLTQELCSIRSSNSARQRTQEQDRTIARMCFGASAGLLAVGTCGCLAEVAIGIGGHLQGLIIFSLGYLCCGLKQQASIWIANRADARERSSRELPALVEGRLLHSEVLPASPAKVLRCEESQRFRIKSLNCI
jgi:hypothetical protein